MPSLTGNDRRSFTPFQKVEILKEHLLEKMPVSKVCQKTQFTADYFLSLAKTVL